MKSLMVMKKKEKFEIIVPDRYEGKTKNQRNYKYINVFHVYKDYVKLLIIEKITKKTFNTVYFDKSDLYDVLEHHWGGTTKNRIPCSSINNKSCTIGQYISKSDFRTHCRWGGIEYFDLRKNQYAHTGNKYFEIDNETMKLEIYRRDSEPYTVLFDKEDYDIISKHLWRVEKDSVKTYTVITKIDYKQISLHRYLLELNGQHPGHRGFRNIVHINNQFDYRKVILSKKHALNTYSFIDNYTFELTINSIHGVVKVIIDSKDYNRVNKTGWEYKKNW